MMAVRRLAAGTWCGASHDGGGDVTGARGQPSSSARAAAPTTARGGASPAGSSATARGSATGSRCSERIRGQSAPVGGIELKGVGNEVVGGLVAATEMRELLPDRRPERGNR